MNDLRPEMEFAEWPIDIRRNDARVLITTRSHQVWGHMAIPGAVIDLRGVHGCTFEHCTGVVLWQVNVGEEARTPRIRSIYGDLPLIEVGVEIIGTPGNQYESVTNNAIGVRLCA